MIELLPRSAYWMWADARWRAQITGLLVFFFFQAEDGIRDLYVTGVQTCALPISNWTVNVTSSHALPAGTVWMGTSLFAAGLARSEERRVGKECRSRWSPYH